MIDQAHLFRGLLQHFPGAPPEFWIRAPGRVNLIGEHVDYNDGLVLPIATQQAIHIVLRKSSVGRIRGFSEATRERVDAEIEHLNPPVRAGWRSFVEGVATELRAQGIDVPGCDFFVASELPTAAGLSSSAALSVGLSLAFLSASNTEMPMIDVARLARRIEHNYVGVPCGIMDPFASALSRCGHALQIDCRTQAIEHIAWPDPDYVVLIIDSGVTRELAGSAYQKRVRQCAEARCILSGDPVCPLSLRDATMDDLESKRPLMPDVVFRRARHVISEIARTARAATALREGDLAAFGRLMNESHESLRTDYEVSLPQLDQLVQIVRETPGVVGARLTGAGFGGCAVAIAMQAAVDTLKDNLARVRDTQYPHVPQVIPTALAAGAEVFKVDQVPR